MAGRPTRAGAPGARHIDDSCRRYPFVAVSVRRGSCARRRRFRSSNFGLWLSRARARAWSASGSGTPPRGPSGEGRGGPGPLPPPPSDSEGPGDGSEGRYSRPGTNIKAMTPRKNNNINSCFRRRRPLAVARAGGRPQREPLSRRAEQRRRVTREPRNAIASAARTRPQSTGAGAATDPANRDDAGVRSYDPRSLRLRDTWKIDIRQHCS
jgi:hypothetical protein